MPEGKNKIEEKVRDIDKYLNNEMTSEERTIFETEMKNNQELADEVAFLKQLTQDVERVALDEHVKKALQALPASKLKKNRQGIWWLFLLLAGVVLTSLLFFQKDWSPKESSSPLPEGPPPIDSLNLAPPQAQVEQVPEQDVAVEKAKNSIKSPIAQSDSYENNFAPTLAPQIRGMETPSDSARQVVLNAVWYTEFPPAGFKFDKAFQEVVYYLQQRDFSSSYARLQIMERKRMSSDTLLFLKGYCLLEQGEGAEALRIFDQIKNQKIANMDMLLWYRCLAWLLLGEDEKAKKICREISADNTNRYKPQAQRTLKVLQ